MTSVFEDMKPTFLSQFVIVPLFHLKASCFELKDSHLIVLESTLHFNSTNLQYVHTTPLSYSRPIVSLISSCRVGKRALGTSGILTTLVLLPESLDLTRPTLRYTCLQNQGLTRSGYKQETMPVRLRQCVKSPSMVSVGSPHNIL